MEERKAKGNLVKGSTDFSSARGDMISNLPDALISQLLSYLPTKEAVRTSVLSNRWESLWLSIPELDLDSSVFPDYNAFVSFVDRFLDFSREQKSCLHKLKLSIHKDKNDQPCVTRWIDSVATPKLEHLDVEFGPVYRECLELIPLSLYICETLLHLILHRVLLGKFESVSLPCLKTMRLEHNVYASEGCLESLISSCPVLEDLSIVRRVDDNLKVLRVRSQTLTSLSIEAGVHDDEVEALADEFEYKELRVLIDAPRLKHLNLNDDISECRTISNWDSLIEVNMLGYMENSDDESRNFFTRISGVRDMQISWAAYVFMEPFPNQFSNLTCLKAQLYMAHLVKLPMFLARCPNLRSLTLDLLDLSWTGQLRFSFVPQCLLSSLEFIEIKNKYDEGPIERELVRYFAENSVVLKKLVVRWERSDLEEDSVVVRDLLALPRRSSECQIVVC